MSKKGYSNLNYKTVKIVLVNQDIKSNKDNNNSLIVIPNDIHHEQNTFVPINESNDDEVECVRRRLFHNIEDNKSLDGQNFILKSLWKDINNDGDSDNDNDDVSVLTEFSWKTKARKLLDSVYNPPPIESNAGNNGMAVTVTPSLSSSSEQMILPSEISIPWIGHNNEWSTLSDQSNQNNMIQEYCISITSSSYFTENKDYYSGYYNLFDIDEKSFSMIQRCNAFDEDDDLNEITDDNSTTIDYQLNQYSTCHYRLLRPSPLHLEESAVGFDTSNIDNPLRCHSCPPPAPKHNGKTTKQSNKFKRFSWKKHRTFRFCHSF